MEEDYFFENYRMADFYDDYYGRNTGDISYWDECCKDAKDILEIACGTGRITLPIINSGKKVYALDYSQAMLDILKEKIKNNSQSKMIKMLKPNFYAK